MLRSKIISSKPIGGFNSQVLEEQISKSESLRAELHHLLGLANTEGLFRSVWATSILQSPDPDPARGIQIGMPEEAINPGLIGRLSIYPWYLETLINEFISIEKTSIYQILPHQ
jgi:hypothetical protein